MPRVSERMMKVPLGSFVQECPLPLGLMRLIAAPGSS